MPQESVQPFSKDKQRSPDDATLVGQVSGPQAEADMRELLGQAEPSGPEQAMSEAELGLSGNEQSAATEAEKTTAEVRRDEYIIWAKAINKDKDWVDETFIFEKDGRVSVPGDLTLKESGITELPSSIYMIGGNFYAYHNGIVSLDCNLETVSGDIILGKNKLNSLKGLPEKMNGILSIEENPLDSLDDLPKFIGKDLWLVNIPATSIPAGLDIGGMVFISEKQKELIADAREKGYKVSEF